MNFPLEQQLKLVLIAQKIVLRGKIKEVLSRAHVCSLEQRAGNAYDQNEQTLSRSIRIEFEQT